MGHVNSLGQQLHIIAARGNAQLHVHIIAARCIAQLHVRIIAARSIAQLHVHIIAARCNAQLHMQTMTVRGFSKVFSKLLLSKRKCLPTALTTSQVLGNHTSYKLSIREHSGL